MKTNQLPPELVEKMQAILSIPVIHYHHKIERAEQCAQIAVDYADEQNSYIIHTFTESLNELQQQRDELVGALRNLVNKHGDNHLTTWITKEVNEAKQLLKKHEDGKE